MPTKRLRKLFVFLITISFIFAFYSGSAVSSNNNIVKGIVQENNTALGYITIYYEDGTGAGFENLEDLSLFRTFNYKSYDEIEVLRNQLPATIDEIQEGDTVYVLLDDNGYISKISSADNYAVKYGRIEMKGYKSIMVEYSDGTREFFDVDDTLIVKNNNIADFTYLEEGDNVKLLINTTNSGISLKAIFCSSVPRQVTGLYKGIFSKIDNLRDTLYIFNVQKLHDGKWIKTNFKGITGVRMSSACEIYKNESIIKPENTRYLSNNTVYVAATDDRGMGEMAEIIHIADSNEREMIFRDEIYTVSQGNNSFRLYGRSNKFNFNSRGIYVKDGKLLPGNSLLTGLDATVVAGRNYVSNDFNAKIVVVESDVDDIKIYRGRISDIDEGNTFTVESYSILNDQDWNYYNTSLTFNINYDTRLVGADRVKNMRDFTGRGETNNIGQTVYVVANGINAVQISEAPFGSQFSRCVAYKIDDTTIMADKVRNYNSSSHVWEEADDSTFSILNDSIIIKKGKIIHSNQLEEGDTLEVVRKDAYSDDVYIVKVITGGYK